MNTHNCNGGYVIERDKKYASLINSRVFSILMWPLGAVKISTDTDWNRAHDSKWTWYANLSHSYGRQYLVSWTTRLHDFVAHSTALTFVWFLWLCNTNRARYRTFKTVRGYNIERNRNSTLSGVVRTRYTWGSQVAGFAVIITSSLWYIVVLRFCAGDSTTTLGRCCGYVWCK